MTDLVDILHEIERIDWGSLHHAYGPATDVPGRIYAQFIFAIV